MKHAKSDPIIGPTQKIYCSERGAKLHRKSSNIASANGCKGFQPTVEYKRL